MGPFLEVRAMLTLIKTDSIGIMKGLGVRASVRCYKDCTS